MEDEVNQQAEDQELGSVVRDEDEAAKKAEEKRRSKMLLISFVAMVFIGLGNKIFQVLQAQPMYNYPLFNNILSTFIYVPASFFYIIPMLRWGSQVTKEARSVPKHKFAVMGILDSIAGIMQSLAVNYIQNGSLVVLLSQAAIPVSMVISRLLLGTKYKISQFVGAIIVGCGLITVLVPRFIGNGDSHHSDDDDSGSSGDSTGSNVAVWAFVMIASMVPQCLSSVYKEIALGDTELDAVYLNGWIAVYQFLAALPLLLPSAPASNLGIKDIPDNLYNGLKCYVGIDTIVGTKHPDDCARAPLFVNLYLVFNIGYNILIILILKYGSANLLWLAMTVMVPLSNFAFVLDFMPGRKPLKWTDILGLVIIMAGLIAYRFWTKFYKSCIFPRFRKEGAINEPLMSPSVVTATPDSPFLGAPGSQSSTLPAGPGTPGRGVHTQMRRGNANKPSSRAERD